MELSWRKIIIRIGIEAFQDCRDLSGVDFSGCSKLEYINSRAFSNCQNLLSLDFTNCTNLSLDNITSNTFTDSSVIRIVNVTNSGLSGETVNSLNTIFKKGGININYIGLILPEPEPEPEPEQ